MSRISSSGSSGSGSSPLLSASSEDRKVDPRVGVLGGVADRGIRQERPSDPWGLAPPEPKPSKGPKPLDLPKPISETWEPDERQVAALAELVQVEPDRIRRAVPEFRLYWLSVAETRRGRKGAKGWAAAFRNRVVMLAERGQLDFGPRAPARPAAPAKRPEPPPVPPRGEIPPPRRVGAPPAPFRRPDEPPAPVRSRSELLAGLAALEAEDEP